MEGALPWLAPTGKLTVEALRKLDQPLLAWAAAGVCVLQQSLPHPFRDVLRYADTDNRPAHRVLFAYAQLLRIKDPAKDAPWFTALVYLNPNDILGARFCAAGGPSDRFPEPV
ncbi:hypothetical protein [Streptomyces sp. SPB4]|uniref:hypothetical protein n=1 Tax=Streptomyces sp. SPB4 TaxID=2940553 RepID=UPI002473AA00|nr:hypothetical protein [Streptomyces sp. SPB4]MDH6538476.1 hypothetical protein [Streptomyces sp. SPB4]